MKKKESIKIEKLVSEKGEFVKKAIDRWYKQIPKEKLDKPIIASLGIKSKVLTPKDIYDDLIGQTSKKSISKESVGLLKEIVEKYGEEEK